MSEFVLEIVIQENISIWLKTVKSLRQSWLDYNLISKVKWACTFVSNHPWNHCPRHVGVLFSKSDIRFTAHHES